MAEACKMQIKHTMPVIQPYIFKTVFKLKIKITIRDLLKPVKDPEDSGKKIKDLQEDFQPLKTHIILNQWRMI